MKRVNSKPQIRQGNQQVNNHNNVQRNLSHLAKEIKKTRFDCMRDTESS